MHFAKRFSLSQVQHGLESQPPSKALVSHEANKAETQQPTMHSRSQSPYFSPPHAFAISIEPVSDSHKKSAAINQPFYRLPAKNSETPKSKKYLSDYLEKGGSKGLTEGKTRKTSENNIIYENEEAEQEKEDLFLSGNLNKYAKSPKNGYKLKERKASCNIEVPTFLKWGRKNSENNSEKKGVKDPGMVKKKSMGWVEDNNFQLSANLNSDQAQHQDEPNRLTEIPKIQSIRKQSENESPRKPPPTFLTQSKNHRRSIDAIDFSKKSKLGIEHFIILKELGKGAFGRVILAVQRDSGTIFAIKIMSKRLIKEGSMIEQLVRQLKLQQHANHPNIIKVYGFFDDLLHFYTIMECASDNHLGHSIKKRTSSISEIESGTIMSQICQAVSYLHTEQIIHRDLKPDNILFHEGVVKITDFGWSVRRDSCLRTTFCGTPVYLCPQILIGDEYDESVDIWTIGIILYEIYYKTNPFRISCKQQLINILNEPINFDEKVVVSATAKDFICSCLKKRAVERPNIRELLLHELVLKAAASEEQRR